jgi:hypothetical protein
LRFFVSLVAVLVLAGCVDGARPAASPIPPSSSTLQGRVLDEEVRPVAGADVTWVGGAVATDHEGRFVLSLALGERVGLRIEHAGFEPLVAEVRMEQTVVAHEFRLRASPRAAVHNLTYQYHGHLDCAWDAVILGGDCLVLYRNATGQDDPVTKEQHAFRLPVLAGWSRIVVGLSWKMAAENQFEGMRLDLEHGNGSAHGHATSVAREQGPSSPLRLELLRGVVHPHAEDYDGTKTKARLADSGEEMQVRVFPRGRFSNELGTFCFEGKGCLLGLGLGLELDFEVEATVFYAPPAEG